MDYVETTNSSVYKKIRKKQIAKKFGKCSFCKPHQNENSKRYKHGPKKPKYKIKRK